jgi:hypothetical protein
MLASGGDVATLSALTMGAFEFVMAGAVLALVSFQIWLTVRVFRCKAYERKQKIWQAQLIWLLPIIGAGLVFTILQDEDRAQHHSSQLKS